MPPAAQPAPVNMHMHSSFSFNADDQSPTQLAAEAHRRALHAIAICDFDVLDGLDEFLRATDTLPIRAAVGMETRVFFPEYADKDINSPGEPGVYYFMGMGFPRVPAAESPAGRTLSELRNRSAARNRALIARIARAIPQLAIDYDADVLPLTPSGNATERHIVRAYVARIRRQSAGDKTREAQTWAALLNVEPEAAARLANDDVALQNALRAKLMKRGGPGYTQPDSNTFPPLEQVIAMIIEAGAVPMATWLDGLSEGESDMPSQLECLRTKGVAALNIIPDRNWNISNTEVRDRKIRKLHELVTLADKMQIPVNVGTELNSFGQPFVDDFQAEPMRPLAPAFFRGANIMVGHARLSRWADYSYCSAQADTEFGADRPARNAFFEAVGLLPCPDEAIRRNLQNMTPDRTLDAIRNAARAGSWK